MSDESKWHGHGIFDQDCLKCQIRELEAEKSHAWETCQKAVERGMKLEVENKEQTRLLDMSANREAKLITELKALRRGVDNLKVRAYELGQRELHDMALELLRYK